MRFHIIIPARFSSQRLPGKMLLEVAGKPLIQHVYERALMCGAASVLIATDDERIRLAAEAFGAEVYMTSVHHVSGTDRLSEVIRGLNWADDEIVVNIQGDEPLIPPTAVQQVAEALAAHPEAAVASLCTPIRSEAEVFDPNLPKVVLDKAGYALYFSRAPIPWDRTQFDWNKNRYYRHIGLYAYRAKTLKAYALWEHAPLEEIEMLEQLRVLWHGEKIYLCTVEDALPAGIDTESDLEKFRERFV